MFNEPVSDRIEQREVKILARNALWMVISVIWPSVVMAVSVPLFYHFLGANDYGLWVVANSLLGVMGILNFGMGAATMKYVAEYTAKGDEAAITRVFLATQIMYLLFGLVGTLVIWALGPMMATSWFHMPPGQAERGTVVFHLVALGFFPSIALLSITSLFEGYQEFHVARGLVMLRYTLIVAVGGAVVVAGHGIVALMLSMVGSLWVLVLVGGVLALRRLVWLRPGEWHLRSTLRRVLGFGVSTMLMGFGQRLAQQADKILLGSLIGLDAMVYYSVPQNVVLKTGALTAAVSKTLIPYFSYREARDGTGKLGATLGKGWRLSILVALGVQTVLMAAAPNLLTLWMGEEFAAHAVAPMLILSGAAALSGLSIVPIAYLYGTDRPAVVALRGIIGGLSILAAMALLAPRFGVIGAAVGYLAFPLIMTDLCRKVAREAQHGLRAVTSGFFAVLAIHGLAAIAGIGAGHGGAIVTGSPIVGLLSSLGVAGVILASVYWLLRHSSHPYLSLPSTAVARWLGRRRASDTRPASPQT